MHGYSLSYKGKVGKYICTSQLEHKRHRGKSNCRQPKPFYCWGRRSGYNPDIPLKGTIQIEEEDYVRRDWEHRFGSANGVGKDSMTGERPVIKDNRKELIGLTTTCEGVQESEDHQALLPGV